MLKLVFCLILVVLLLPLNLVAAPEENSISYSSSIQITDFSWYSGQSFSLLKFNSAYGELQSIKVEMNFGFFGDVNLSAPLAKDPVDIILGDISAYFHPELYADFKLIPGRITQTVPISGPLPPGYNQIIYEDFSWNDQYNIDLLDVSNALDEYTGNGNIPLGIQTGFSSTIDSTPISVFMNGVLDVDCEVTYNYVVPEPASVLILATGCIVVLRRKKSNL